MFKDEGLFSAGASTSGPRDASGQQQQPDPEKKPRKKGYVFTENEKRVARFMLTWFAKRTAKEQASTPAFTAKFFDVVQQKLEHAGLDVTEQKPQYGSLVHSFQAFKEWGTKKSQREICDDITVNEAMMMYWDYDQAMIVVEQQGMKMLPESMKDRKKRMQTNPFAAPTQVFVFTP